MKKKIFLIAVILVFGALVFSSCAIFTPGALPHKTEQEIWQEVRDRNGSLFDFRGEAEITIESGFRVVPVEAKIFYRAPDWITIRTYGPMGIKLVEASLQKNRFQVYSLFTNEFFSGNLDSVNLATRFKLPLPNMDMRTAWQRLFNYTRPQETQIEVRNSGKFYILSYTQEQNLHEIWVDSRKMLVERENLLDSTGVLQYYTAYSRYKKRSGVRFPRHIEMGDIARGVKLKIEISDFKLNSSVSDADMMLSVPLEAKRVEL